MAKWQSFAPPGGLGWIELVRHEATPAPGVRAIHTGAAFTADGALALNYRIGGERDRLAIPASAAPRRGEDLWRHTCLEAFVMGADAPAYREFNISPSGAWQAYAFHAYRQGGPLAQATAPRIARDEDAVLNMQIHLPASALPPGPRLRLGLTAVIEAADGGLSYWALRHPPGRPDFHHSDGFVLELTRP